MSLDRMMIDSPKHCTKVARVDAFVQCSLNRMKIEIPKHCANVARVDAFVQ